jgi:DNA-directed RNA polymerase subunit RPC12/RpoP
MAKTRATSGANAGARPKVDEVAVGLACPSCQGRLRIPEGVRIIRCPYCDQRSLVRGDRGVLRYQVPRRLDRNDALAKARGFLRGLDRAPGLAQRADFTDLFVVYLPFWSEWAEVAAWFFGKKKVGSGKNRRLVPKEVRLMGTRSWNQAACDVQEFGVNDISLAGQALQAFEADALHGDGMVFEPVSAAGAAWAEAAAAIESDVRSEASLDVIASERIERLGSRRALVYFPLWVARYTFRNRSYQIVLDGTSGKVLYGKAPGNIWFRAAALVGGFALGALLLVDGTALAGRLVWSSDDSDSFLIVLVPMALGGGLMLAAYRRFRFGELLEHRVSFRRRRRPGAATLGDPWRVWGDLSRELMGGGKK